MSKLAKQIIDDLWHKNRNFCSSDYDDCIDYINTILPLEIHTYRTEKNDDGWVIPPKWDLISATISDHGKVLFSATSPLHVIGLSLPFQGEVSIDELKKHLHTDKRFPDCVPFHFRQNYRPWDRTWGFCVPQIFFDSLDKSSYQVHIDTQESVGYLKIAEHVKHGQYPFGFAFVAHLDHGGMANDDLAGVAVGIELFKRLSSQNTKFTYRMIIVQEIIGSQFFLKYNRDPDIIESCFLEMLGSRTPLALQSSFQEKSYLENVMESVLLQEKILFKKGKFREIICNDECVWESVGIPMASLSRFPYLEYHSDKDNPDIIDGNYIEEAINVLEKTIQKIENSTLIHKKFNGVIGLSHPDYDLYIDPGQPAFNTTSSESQKKLRRVMDYLPLLPQYSFAETLAKSVDIPLEDMVPYLKRWESKGLLEII